MEFLRRFFSIYIFENAKISKQQENDEKHPKNIEKYPKKHQKLLTKLATLAKRTTRTVPFIDC
jgi:hypothetical protein